MEVKLLAFTVFFWYKFFELIVYPFTKKNNSKCVPKKKLIAQKKTFCIRKKSKRKKKTFCKTKTVIQTVNTKIAQKKT